MSVYGKIVVLIALHSQDLAAAMLLNVPPANG